VSPAGDNSRVAMDPGTRGRRLGVKWMVVRTDDRRGERIVPEALDPANAAARCSSRYGRLRGDRPDGPTTAIVKTEITTALAISA